MSRQNVELLFNLHAAYCESFRLLERLLISEGCKVTPVQYKLLRILFRLGSPSELELAQMAGLTRSTVSRNLKLLTQWEYTSRLTPANRKKNVALTDKGEEVMDMVEKLLAPLTHDLCAKVKRADHLNQHLLAWLNVVREKAIELKLARDA